jgi:hypothetical protein
VAAATCAANTDWCEPNYLWSHYIAEFWNTLSCIPICTFALHGLSQCYRHSLELKFWASYLGVLVIGIGSVAFHGTLHRWGQVMDEVPMLWASLCFLYVSMTMDGARPLLAAGLTCWGAFSTIVYFSWGFHLFVVMCASRCQAALGRGVYVCWSDTCHPLRRCSDGRRRGAVFCAREQAQRRLAAAAQMGGSSGGAL